MSTALIQFGLNIGSRSIEASARVPSGATRVQDLLPALNGLCDSIVAAAVARSEEEEGEKISCQAGCGACCRQIVPVSEHEARGLAELVASMPEGRRATVESRFRDALSRLAAGGLGRERLSSIADLDNPDQRRELGLSYFHSGVPCPFLEEESCGIYEHRPMNCREYLVTSPAADCANPSAETVRMVRLAAKPSNVLMTLGSPGGRGRYLPLVLALEFSAEAPPEPALDSGPAIFQKFLKGIASR